jgi:hypothetical protein
LRDAEKRAFKFAGTTTDIRPRFTRSNSDTSFFAKFGLRKASIVPI